MAKESKDAEGCINRLKYLLDNEFKKTLADAEAKATDKMSEALQKRRMIIKDMEYVVESCNALMQEHAKVLIEVSNFVEQINANVMINNNAIPCELFKEQALLFNEAYAVLTKRYAKIGADYFNTAK